MANLSDSRLSDSERDIADVDGLFADESSPPPLSPAAAIPSSSSQGSAFGDSDSYDLLEDDETRTEPAQPLQPVPIATTAPPKPKSRPKPKAASPRAEERETEPSDEDDAEEEGDAAQPLSHSDPEEIEPWSRLAEWRSNLIILAAAAIIVGWLVWHFLAQMAIGSAILALLGGVVLLGLLSYPILITLEPPIRMTPEQALRDFCDAISHGRPHYRRMWLLLTPRGQALSGDFAAFKRHWSKRLEELGGPKANHWSNVEFTVVQFRLKKSKDQTTATAKYEIHAMSSTQEFLGRLKGRAAFTKGTDRMWHLEDGRL